MRAAATLRAQLQAELRVCEDVQVLAQVKALLSSATSNPLSAATQEHQNNGREVECQHSAPDAASASQQVPKRQSILSEKRVEGLRKLFHKMAAVGGQLSSAARSGAGADDHEHPVSGGLQHETIEQLDALIHKAFFGFDKEQKERIPIADVREVVSGIEIAEEIISADAVTDVFDETMQLLGNPRPQYSVSEVLTNLRDLIPEMLDALPKSRNFLHQSEFATLIKAALGIHLPPSPGGAATQNGLFSPSEDEGENSYFLLQSSAPQQSVEDNLNQTILRAKQLAQENFSYKNSLDTQMTNLLHMQHHYRLIANAKSSIDTWHYGKNSKCFHALIHPGTAAWSSSPEKNRSLALRVKQNRLLPLERMHLLLLNDKSVRKTYQTADRHHHQQQSPTAANKSSGTSPRADRGPVDLGIVGRPSRHWRGAPAAWDEPSSSPREINEGSQRGPGIKSSLPSRPQTAHGAYPTLLQSNRPGSSTSTAPRNYGELAGSTTTPSTSEDRHGKNPTTGPVPSTPVKKGGPATSSGRPQHPSPRRVNLTNKSATTGAGAQQHSARKVKNDDAAASMLPQSARKEDGSEEQPHEQSTAAATGAKLVPSTNMVDKIIAEVLLQHQPKRTEPSAAPSGNGVYAATAAPTASVTTHGSTSWKAGEPQQQARRQSLTTTASTTPRDPTSSAFVAQQMAKVGASSPPQRRQSVEGRRQSVDDVFQKVAQQRRSSLMATMEP
ncbi:unnamed protein product [Amoebophrya sp. A120]|nr:unnamed protein product [Amoebophrya sp. A120]|eukprot:GSA120T00006534001.1